MTVAALVLLWVWGEPLDAAAQAMLARLAEEAELFHRTAPKLLAQETLRQRALRIPRRFRPRVGAAAAEPPKLEYRTREIVSEYSYGAFRDAPGILHEFRQVIAVDGRPVTAPAQARRKLLAGVRSADDRVKRRMLEEFERHGLSGAAADFGQLILLFRRQSLGNYRFARAGAARVGAEPSVILSFLQVAGQSAVTIFEKGRAIREPLQGRLWLREPDGLPLRIAIEVRRPQGDQTIFDEATVDYAMSSHGVIAPVSVVRKRLAGDRLLVEDVFQYSGFRLFSVETEVTFP